ncbi:MULTISPECIES: hypothetical protein [Croceibacter]|uniref:hypothetical protein n=1 Tax=Croceibacter TaxID=216431 RepID=UPI000C4DB7FC|nr:MULTISPECIES: hypothetical protein [Croceibacter]MBG27019.1 hypothetical protein [Croceibacter sp.]|tara:strand:+ start:411 stop:998 length:588 start_codon:yes stop_codon:yes gene_type:complete
MKKEFVEQFLLVNGKYFPKSKLSYIGRQMEKSKVSEYIVNKGYWNPITTFILMFIFLGFGFMMILDRLILGDWLWGLLKLSIPILIACLYFFAPDLRVNEFNSDEIILLLSGLFLLWVLIDIFTLYSRIKIRNYNKLMNTLNSFWGSFERKKFNFDKPLEIKTIDTETLSSFDKWRKENPSKSINDFYREQNSTL